MVVTSEALMHDIMTYDQIQGYEPVKVGHPSIFKSYLIHHFVPD